MFRVENHCLKSEELSVPAYPAENFSEVMKEIRLMHFSCNY